MVNIRICGRTPKALAAANKGQRQLGDDASSFPLTLRPALVFKDVSVGWVG
jgi:hypothetical protein